MDKSAKIAFGALLLLVLVLTYLEASEPEPVNWNPSYLETDKIALGSYVFYDSWQNVPNSNLEKVTIPPFEFLDENLPGTYFFLNNYLNFDDAELKKLLRWVEEGNTVFLAASYYSENLLDTLKLKTSTRIPGENFTSQPYLQLTNKNFRQEEPYHFSHDVNLEYFSRLDTLEHTVLGVAGLHEFEEPTDAFPVFLRTGWGNGRIFIHSFPQAFSNYFLLSNENYSYAASLLAYLEDDGSVYWDRYYKSGKTFYSSPLYMLLSNKALKWAYYFLLIGSVLFIIFEGKRKQRPVPVVEPLKNQTLEYAKTVGDLYLEKKQYRELALKKIDHFNDYIRNRYRIATSWQDEKFYRELAEKSDHTEEETRQLYGTFKTITAKAEITKDEFRELNEKIDSFKL